MTWWKGIFDAKHGRGQYYGRVTFVQADEMDTAIQQVQADGRAEFPECDIAIVAVRPSTADAAEAFRRQREETAAWKRRNRIKMCPACGQEIKYGD